MKQLVAILLVLTCISKLFAQEYSIPAFTAYFEPDQGYQRNSNEGSISQCSLDNMQIKWFFNLKNVGTLDLSIDMATLDSEPNQVEISIADKKFIVEIPKTTNYNDYKRVNIGKVQIEKAGYYEVSLKSVGKKKHCSIKSLILKGEAAKDVHFNSKERRNAASVHLFYPQPKDVNIEWFYCEIVVPVGYDPIYTYYEACGFDRGYFGIQVNDTKERRIIFSVWDAGNEAVDRNKVNSENRVKVIDKGKNVYAGDFGNEGTGGHSHLVYNWKTGDTCRFLLHAQPNGTFTTYTAYFYFKESNEWKLISSLQAPKDGKYLSGLYSFLENFGGGNGQLPRKAYYGNQWIKTDKNQWIELTHSSFSHDETGKNDRLDYGGGVENGFFYLFNGGFVPKNANYGDKFERPATQKTPTIPVFPKENK